MPDINRRNLLKTSVAASLGCSITGIASATDDDTEGAPLVKGDLKRFATMASGAETTGPYVIGEGSHRHEQPGQGVLIFSHQHPANSSQNEKPFRKASVGYVQGYNFDTHGKTNGFNELSIPNTTEKQGKIRVAAGEYEVLAYEKQPINGEKERFGVPETPDGTPIDSFSGSKYAAFGNAADMNQFVATPGGEYDGYLYTNHETSPGTLTRMPITIAKDGTLEPDLDNTTNLANYESFRDIGGTRINCYGDMTPWGTPVSAEEDFTHARVSQNETVSSVVENDGIGRGSGAFFNRPNPTNIQSKVNEYFDSSWTVQGTFGLAGLELLAYYLGAEPVDQSDDGNDVTPLGGPFPNPYRYAHLVEFRNPDATDPADIEPVKHYVLGRGSWEAPDFQQDQRTVYMTSDGSYKGIYKFVADRPFPSYRDPMDVAGTLYAPDVTNGKAVKNSPPGKVNLELEWIKIGHASNGEVESWIAEYDDVTQVDYLEMHTDWEEGEEVTDEVIKEADREVIRNGNKAYIPDEDIIEWAEQYAEYGPDGVDEELRKVPFLETRAAAKEIGATIEFRKAEGIDSADPATPGDYIYVGISELNDGMADDEGTLQLERVDGGVVYRAELESDYNISTLEPVIVGPDATDPANVSDDSLLNIDNIFVLGDGRVICCEDADQLGRSYSNDCLYVYTPEDRSPSHTRGRGKGN